MHFRKGGARLFDFPILLAARLVVQHTLRHQPVEELTAEIEDSKNQGFTVLDKDAVHCKVRFCGEILDWTLGEETKIPEALQKVMETVCKDYTYLLR